MVRRTPLGNALVNAMLVMPQYHPEVQVLHFCLMPDHLHFIIYVRHTMPTGIGAVVRGFWQGAKKLGRAASVAMGASSGPSVASSVGSSVVSSVAYSVASSSLVPNVIRVNPQGAPPLYEQTSRLEAYAAGLLAQMGADAYYALPAIFTEKPFIRPMGRNTQLPNTIHYIDMNPQRLATKRLKPGFFHVQRDITIHGRSYDGVGNTMLLMAQSFAPVHVRSAMVAAAEHGETESLRNYMNSCVLKARQGVVMVSPFISTQEKMVMQVLLREQRPFIILLDNGFRDFFKPSDALFDACASGRVLLLSPWPYDATKRHISRADCVALNQMAEEICSM